MGPLRRLAVAGFALTLLGVGLGALGVMLVFQRALGGAHLDASS
jgi:hypothetical protein